MPYMRPPLHEFSIILYVIYTKMSNENKTEENNKKIALNCYIFNKDFI